MEMAPYANYETGEIEPVILYNEYRQNEQNEKLKTSGIPPMKNNDGGTEKRKIAQAEENENAEKQKHFQVRDDVVVKQMDIKEMKKLQKNHGEWNPRMENAMGKIGTVVHIFPDGDLLVLMENMEQPFVFNPECVSSVEKSSAHYFQKGGKARLKDLPTEQMKEIQEVSGEWLPVMEDMKNRLCVVKWAKFHTVRVKMMNGLVLDVNRSLLEKVDQDVEEKQHERCYKKGDTVEIKNIEQDQLREMYKKYDIEFQETVLKARNKIGEVVQVDYGRFVHVKMHYGMMILCCPPILELKSETTDDDESSDDEDLTEELQDVFSTHPHQQLLQDFLTPLFPSGIPSDIEQLLMKSIKATQEALVKFAHGATGLHTDNGEDQPKREPFSQDVTFQKGDVVLVRNMDVNEMKKKQERHGGWNAMMKSAIGKQGRVEHVYPSGDLHISMEDTHILWYLNPECVQLVAKSEQHCFEKGQKVRFRNLPTEEMTRLQEYHGGWVPLMEDMKNKLCTIQNTLPYQLVVRMMDGYVWVVNPKIVELVGQELHEEHGARCFRKGDIVRIKNMPKDEMKKLSKHHGIGWDNEIYHAKQLRGKVISVTKGRIVETRMDDGKVLVCCRPILDLEEESTEEYDDSSENEDIDFSKKVEELQQRMKYGSLLKLSISHGPTGRHMGYSVYSSPRDLLSATATGNVDTTNAILKEHPHWIDAISEDGHHTVLMNACAAGSIDVVKILVEAGARIDMDNIEGNTPIIVAAWKGDREILEYLLNKGAKLGVTNSNGQNALHAAILSDSEECVQLLLKRCNKHDFYAKANDGRTPVTLAITKKNTNICRMIFDSTHFQASSEDENGFTALHEAAKVGNEYAAKLLLEMHPQGINQQKRDMWTPLHLAALNNNTSVLEVLLAHKNCDKNILNEDKETPLFLAVNGCLKEIVKLLLKSGADANIQNEDGDTCLHQIFKLREKSVYEPTMPAGNTIKSLPSQKQWLDLASLLISKGASVDVVNNNGDKPLDYIKDDTVKADILTEIEAGNSIKNNLQDFQKQLEDFDEAVRVKQVYQTSTFAARYFDDKGGYLEIEKAGVRLYIPPGAVNQTELVYINLDPVNHGVKGKLSPVVQAGPPGTNFKKQITLSYPHCAADESKWKFSTLTSDDAAAKVTDWKEVKNEEGIESRIKNGRTIIKTLHFTRYTTIGASDDTLAEKNMRIGAFGKDYRQGKSSYQFRVRTWEDTEATTQVVHKKELEYLETKPIDDDHPFLVRNTKKDVSVKVNDIKKGWRVRRKEGVEQHLKFDQVWHNQHPSCTVDLDVDKTEGSASGTTSDNVHCYIKAKQIEAPDGVDLSISPNTITCEEEVSHSSASKPTVKEDLYGPTPDIPNMPKEFKELYLDLCGILNREDDVNGDWRTVMSVMDMGDETTVANTRNLKSNKDSPANFALRHYLTLQRAEGSDDPIGDLCELFKTQNLHEARQCLENYLKSHQTQNNN